MAKTSRDARRHIREWSEFFRSGRAVAEAGAGDLINSYEKRKYLAQSLKRLIGRGFVKKEGKLLKPTGIGMRFFRRLVVEKKQPGVSWDGKWKLVSFDVPGGYNRARDDIRNLLREFNFRPLHKSVWISPTSVSQDFWKLIVDNGFDKYCKTMVVEIIEGEEDLLKRFNF